MLQDSFTIVVLHSEEYLQKMISFSRAVEKYNKEFPETADLMVVDPKTIRIVETDIFRIMEEYGF